MSDLRTPWSLHVVSTLGIPGFVASGIGSVETLAHRAGCDAEALKSVLRHLVSRGVFEEPADGVFVMNAASHGLLEPGIKLGLDLNGIGGRMAYAWGTLLGFVRTGRPAYADRFGLPFWEDLDAHPAVSKQFDELIGPQGHGVPDPDVLIGSDWNSIRRVVDVGGGTGSLLAEILILHSHLTGVLVDLPRTVVRSSEIFASAGVTDRVAIVGQSFFDPLPAGGDLYVLKSVLNDWPDPDALIILRRCAEAMDPRGRVVVIGGVSGGERSWGLSIETVLFGGKDRTVAEFNLLAQQAGLEVTNTGYQTSGRFVVECRLIKNANYSGQ